MKKFVILNASPRPNSNITQMLSIMRNELLACGAKVHYVDVCKLQFRPCIGCMECRSEHECVMPDDDAKAVLRLVQERDALIIGSPCYWGNMTGQLKTLFDRWVYGMMDHSEKGYPIPLLKGKKAVIITACSTPWPFNILFKQSAGTVRAIKEVLYWSGFKIAGVLQKGGTVKNRELSSRETVKCRKIANKLLSLVP